MKVVMCLFLTGFYNVMAMQAQFSSVERQIYQGIIRGTVVPNSQNIDCIDQIGKAIPSIAYTVYALKGIYSYSTGNHKQAAWFFQQASTKEAGLDCMICWLNYIKTTNENALRAIGLNKGIIESLEAILPSTDN